MRKLLVLFVLLFTLMGNSLAQLNWVKHGSPVLLAGSAGEWDDDGVGIPCVIFDGNTYKMWYSGSDGSHFRIGYATSPDGINWTKYNDPSTVNPPYAESDPVLNLGPGAWENVWVYCPIVFFDGTTYHMWYAGTDGVHDRVGYATSPDGIIWTKNPANPVISLGTSGSWDDTSVDPGPVIFDGTTFHMMYNGSDGPHYQGGYATSPDGINWTKSGDPILVYGSSGSWDNPRVQPNSVVYNSSTSKYYLFYSGGVMLDWRIGYATSSDFSGPWTKSPSILLDVTPSSFDSDVIAFPYAIYDSISEEYKMWYSGGSSGSAGAIGYATSDVETIDTIYIPNDYTTIQEGIDVAETSNIILVDEGTYNENINFKGKAITVASKFILDHDTSHISKTIINGSQPSNPNNASVVTFNSGEDTTSIICGFTITGGKGTIIYDGSTYRGGGGIVILNSGAKIINNIVEYNKIEFSQESWGGGIAAFATGREDNIVIENNIIKYNEINTPSSVSYSLGGGMYIGLKNYVRIAFNKILYNTITSPMAYGGGIAPYAIKTLYIYNNLIKGNKLNSSAGGSGGIDIYFHAPIVRNNIIVDNHAPNGGAMCIETTPTTNLNKQGLRSLRSNGVLAKIAAEIIPHFENNTILNNNAKIKGGGFYISGKKPEFTNCIIWGNTAPTDLQISGAANISYSDVEGGYSGVGNLNLNPDFADTINYYLNPNSPCVDAGNPDSAYFDIENPTNPGYALFPALGTIHNDIGAYGGHPFVKIETPKELLGEKFKAFVDRVNSTIEINKQAVIDSFMNTVSSFPYIEEDTIVYYIYQGQSVTVSVPGDANNWAIESSPMTNLSGTNFWYYEAVYETDARLDYKFVLNGSDWILDPLNPNQVSGGYGPNSELAMQDYVQPPEIEYYPNISHGTIESFSFTSSILGNSRVIKVYKPAEYDLQPATNYPLLLLHDGLDYLNIGSVQNILDYLIANEKTESIICVFVPPVDRDDEYGLNKTQQFESFILEELMPHIDSIYRTSTEPDKRAMGGLSLGGLITTQICYNHPESFGLAAAFSPAYWAHSKTVYNSVINGEVKQIKWYIDWGSYEPVIMTDGYNLSNALIDKSYDLIWKQWNEAHSWGSWRAHLDIALEYFFPGEAVDVRDQSSNSPLYFSLGQNFPNPFNPSTTIKYQIPAKVKSEKANVKLIVYDMLGREVTKLVNEKQKPGIYEVVWDASKSSSGVYFYKLSTSEFSVTKKLILMK